jgi:predicted PilT family ATPase
MLLYRGMAKKAGEMGEGRIMRIANYPFDYHKLENTQKNIIELCVRIIVQ